jgi:hypothetical protein
MKYFDLFVYILIFFVLFFLFYYLFSFFYDDSGFSDVYGVYVSKTNLPSFLANSIEVEFIDNGKKVVVFLGRSNSLLKVYMDGLYFRSFIYTNYISNFDIFIANYKFFKLLRSKKNDVFFIEFWDKGLDKKCYLQFNNFKDNVRFSYRYDPLLLNKNKILRLHLYLYSDNKGYNFFVKNIYIKRISLKLNLLKKN